MHHFTSDCRKESLHRTAYGSHREIPHHTRVNGNGESKADHDQSGHSQVHQDEVERLTELLVLSCDHERQSVDGEAGDEQEKHVEPQ